MGGGEPSQIIQQLPGGGNRKQTVEEKAQDDERAHFVKVVLAETEDVWNKIF